MAIHTIIFDLGQTLVPFDLSRLNRGWSHCRERALQLCDQVERGVLDGSAFRAAMCRETGMAEAGFDAWWNSIFDRRWLLPPAAVLGLKAGHRLGLLSNTNAPHFAFLLEHFPELAEFDFHVLSHEVGAAKPDAKIYAAAERAAGCAPGEILYFDDVPAFVAAARARGWQARLAAEAEAALAALVT